MLEELNTLLAKEATNLPEFRSQVHTSGSNLLWLRKALKNAELSPRLRELLALDINKLNKN